jgi:hypothetical protein
MFIKPKVYYRAKKENVLRLARYLEIDIENKEYSKIIEELHLLTNWS